MRFRSYDEDTLLMTKSKTYLFNRPEVPYDAVPAPWCIALRSSRLFVYWKEECMPRYVFDKEHTTWVGHGQRFRSVAMAMNWVVEQHSARIQIG